MPKKVRLKPCPFCGFHGIDAGGVENEHWVLFCVHCEAQGPRMDAHELALAAWNRRAKVGRRKK